MPKFINQKIFSSIISCKKSEIILPKEVIDFMNHEMNTNLPNIIINDPKKDLNYSIQLEEAHNLLILVIII
jgi:hypothetical protein